MKALGMAVKLLKRLEAASAAQQSALAANAADIERLQKMDGDIATLDKNLDPENLSGLHGLAARRDQRERLAKKFSTDAEKRLRDADAASVISDQEISELFWEIQADLREQIILSVRLFVSDDSKAARFAENCDSFLLLTRHANTWGSLPLAQRFTGLLPVLKQYLDGKPPWIFTTAASEPSAHDAAGEFGHHAPGSSGDGVTSGGGLL